MLELSPGQRVADIASGPGATARLLAAEFGVVVDGIDVAERSIERARLTTCRAGLAQSARFHVGDAERIPFANNTFDAVVTECSYCTFPDKKAAAAELARVLRPSGRFGLADVTIAEGGLPDELTSVSAWVACIADARPLTQYRKLLTDAGLHVTHMEQHDEALTPMIDHIEARLHLARMTFPQALEDAGVDCDAALGYVEIARRAVADDLIGYALIVAEKRDTATKRHSAER